MLEGCHSSSNDGSYLQAGACCKHWAVADIEAALARRMATILMPKSAELAPNLRRWF